MQSPSLPPPDASNGLKLYQLLITANPARRRVETVRFQENGRVRRSVSLDYLIPRDLLIRPLLQGDAGDDSEASTTSFLAPIALLQKAPLVMVDVQDESGRSLPILSTTENGIFAYHALVAAADRAARGLGSSAAPEQMRADLFAVAAGTAADAGAAVDRLLTSSDELVASIAKDPVVRKLAADLSANFVLLAELGEGPVSRRITKFSYTTRTSIDAGYFGLHPLLAAWQAIARPHIRTLVFTSPGIGDTPSYHFQIEPPGGVVVTRCELQVIDPAPEGPARAPAITGQIEGGVGHVHVAELDPEASGSVVVDVSPSSHGLVASACVASALILAVSLTLLLLQTTALIDLTNSRDWGSFLLAIPAIAAGFLVNQSESGLVSRLITPVRVTLVVSALMSFALAFVIATMAAVPGLLPWALWTTTVVGAACFAWLTLWWRQCRRALVAAGVN